MKKLLHAKHSEYLGNIRKNKAAVIFLVAFCMFSGIIIGNVFQSESPKSLQLPTLSVKQINLVSSVTAIASQTDTKLTNAWGVAFGHAGRVWVNTNSGFSTVYDGVGKAVLVADENGQKVPLAVKIPSPSTSPDQPASLTGIVFSEHNDFLNDSFIFVTEQGTVAGWSKLPTGFHPLTATMRVDNSAKGAVYKGATSAKTKKGWLLYVANFGQNSIDVFNAKYEQLSLKNTFTDPTLPKGYAPFNVSEIQGKIFVSYAKQSIDKANDVKGLGNGYIDIFDYTGRFIKRFASNGALNSPWGLAMTPKKFGSVGAYLLVGNFGDGYIHIFDPETGAYIGVVKNKNNQPLQIDGLWSLTFGTNNGVGKDTELFFSAGASAETQGIFGKLQL